MQSRVKSVNEFERELELRKRAARAAKAGAIRSDATSFDDGQHSIVEHMMAYCAEHRGEVANSLEQHQKRRVEIEAEIQGFPRQSFAKAVDGAVRRALKTREEDLKTTEIAAEKAKRAIKAYRLRYEIDRAARSQRNKWILWGIIAVVFLVESIANSRFFAQASDFGLVGGWLQACTISGINIGLGLIGGFLILPKRAEKKLAAESTVWPTVCLCTLILVVFVFNLSTAHYRVMLEADPDNAVRRAISDLINSPFGIDNFDAWVLFVAGLLASGLAAIDSYFSDDPLREYGQLSRDNVSAAKSNAEMRQTVIDEAFAALGQRKQELHSAARRSKLLMADFRSLIARSKADSRDYKEWRSQVEETTRTLLTRYRGYYLQVHEVDPRPAYFEERYEFPEDKPFLEEELRMKQAEEQVNNLENILKALEGHRDASIESEAEVTRRVEEAADSFIARIEGLALKRVAEENPALVSPAELEESQESHAAV